MTTSTEHRTVKAQEKLADSAETLADSAETQEDSATRRTHLAADRTLLAAERTYAAWMRTGLASLAAGVGAKSLLEDLVHPTLVMATAIVLLLFAEFCFVAGVWREVTGQALRPDPDTAKLPAILLIVFNGFLVILGIAVLIGIATD